MKKFMLTVLLGLSFWVCFVCFFFGRKYFLETFYQAKTNKAEGANFTGLHQHELDPGFKDKVVCLSVLKNSHNLNVTFPKIYDITSDDDVKNLSSKGCNHVIDKYDFEMDFKHITKEERHFPIAYSILAHQNAHQLMLLLSAIYAPQNVYCIHIDLKSTSMFEAVKETASCFSNVFLATKREDVVYAGFSRLQADINCMEDLVNIPVGLNNWTYLINLCGQDYPLQTNLEAVKMLTEFNGRNVIAGTDQLTWVTVQRTKWIYRVENYTNEDGKQERKMFQTKELKSPPPFNMTILKNLAYNVYTRRFLRWVIFESEKAKALLEWSRDTLTPDEHYWLMLDALEEAPGRSGRISWSSPAKYVKWKSLKNDCSGYWRHSSCVYGARDVNQLIRRRSLFANKFDVKHDSLPITCLREHLEKKKRKERLEIQ
ncbi:N-acetyllactosaminide beta-1,6-N-acetylglucosaminyl-transferase-like [Clavelina lepadiformis]|uniref:N-acetyllactosaminide beta-1,6-N-acetylglucosaminyl-transferase-like n=1 Tax=Clavelina lepadiformis TaxID=159417 RepID=UPI00404158B0